MKKCEIRNDPGLSSYFGGGHRDYGRYQWNVKFYGWQNEWEIEAARLWAFGEYMYSRGGFDELNDLIGRPVKASLSGRSGGWLVIDTELTKAELRKVDRHVKACMKGLPAFLKEERAFNTEETCEEE